VGGGLQELDRPRFALWNRVIVHQHDHEDDGQILIESDQENTCELKQKSCLLILSLFSMAMGRSGW
jgi:hypothetical protein